MDTLKAGMKISVPLWYRKKELGGSLKEEEVGGRGKKTQNKVKTISVTLERTKLDFEQSSGSGKEFLECNTVKEKKIRRMKESD